jgi:hypothetical protein
MSTSQTINAINIDNPKYQYHQHRRCKVSLPSTSTKFTSSLALVYDYSMSEFMQRLYIILYGTLGSCLWDALHEGNANNAVACLVAPRGYTCDFIQYFMLGGGFQYF